MGNRDFCIKTLFSAKPCDNNYFLRYSTFCVIKKWIHSRIGQCVWPGRPARIHDNFWQHWPIEVKVCTYKRLIEISVEFEDENDWSNPSWVIARSVIISYTFLWRYRPILSFIKKKLQFLSHKTSTIIYHSIENFTGYKMVYETLRKICEFLL